jgi:hypothetical protein
MDIIYRKNYSVYKELSVLILDVKRCVNRNMKNLNTTLEVKDIETISIKNIPIGIWSNCISHGFDILVTNFENYKLIRNWRTKINSDELRDANFLILLQYIIENKHKFTFKPQ